ncbi:hypothetical protein BGW38_003487 [Lunasporangiospora selenospora]|uniref:GH18 domain-containing protein n=1 Tax=Lunasporangiospora selenospora TaxID=979761 RepID=A0A9P6FSL7_9FUNG|nr:hypothetical protein BGW38_003487 [Lunasporangiospora selenospora]
MKIPSAVCILSIALTLSLATLGDATEDAPKGCMKVQAKAQAKAHKKQHHLHENKQRGHHHHQHPAAIPAVPYIDHSHQHHDKEESQSPVTEPPRPEAEREAEEHRRKPEVSKEQPLLPTSPQEQPQLPTSPQEVPKKTKSNDYQIADKNMVVAYWTDWTAGTMPPEAIPFDKVTHINYAFAIIRPDFTPVFETGYLLNRIVKLAKEKNVKVLMSIGGWTGSQYFSQLAATRKGRQTFIDGAIQLVKDYDLSGIDIDWEYPGRIGSICNSVDEKNDAKNFLKLLKGLRAAMDVLPEGDHLQISLATRIVPFDGPDGVMTDVSEFAKVVNHINVMAYDINGSWGSVTGANAPFSSSNQLSYEGGAQAWINAGFPANQINMGVPFYGRSLITKRDMTRNLNMAVPFEKHVPRGDVNDDLWTDPCEKAISYSGVWKFRNLREQGIIDEQGNARAPWVRRFDSDSQTPWLFNAETRQFISYDDRESLGRKVRFAKENKLGGVMLWAINQDTKDFELLDVLQEIRGVVFGTATAAYTTVTAAAQSSPKKPGDTATTAAGSSVSPLYTFGGLSKEHIFLSEMRHSRVAWSVISKHFGVTSFEALNVYIRATSKALKFGWTPRMDLKDIEHHLATTPANTARFPNNIDDTPSISTGK